MVRHIETAVRAEVTDNKLSSTAVAADLITPQNPLPHAVLEPAAPHRARQTLNTAPVADLVGILVAGDPRATAPRPRLPSSVADLIDARY